MEIQAAGKSQSHCELNTKSHCLSEQHLKLGTQGESGREGRRREGATQHLPQVPASQHGQLLPVEYVFT